MFVYSFKKTSVCRMEIVIPKINASVRNTTLNYTGAAGVFFLIDSCYHKPCIKMAI